MRDLGTLPGGAVASALSINSRGDIVGESEVTPVESHAFLYRDGAMLDLNNVIDSTQDWTLQIAWDISDNGLIVGWGTHNGDARSFLLTPLIERIPGDYNRNGTVDAADYVVWRNTLGDSGTGLAADGNANDAIDPGDYDVWRANFGTSADSASEEIPEPSRLALAIAAVLVTAICVRNKRAIIQAGRLSRTMSAIAVTLLCGASTLHASTISTFPAFAARTVENTIEEPYPFGQTFVPTPGTLFLTSFTFYVRFDPPAPPLTFSLYQSNGVEFSSPFFTGTPTSTPYQEPPKPGISTGFMEVRMQTGMLPVVPGLSYFATIATPSIDRKFIPILCATTDCASSLYPDGSLNLFQHSGLVFPQRGDAAFTAEFVGGEDRIYGTIPEPATGWLSAFAIVSASICATMRHRASRRTNRRISSNVAALIVLTLPSAASAGLIVFDNEADFLAAADVVSTETFDEFPTNTLLGRPSATVDGVTYTAINPPPDDIPSPPWGWGWFAGPKLYFSERRDVTKLTFGEEMVTNAIGFSVDGQGISFPTPEYTFTVLLGNGEQSVEHASGNDLIYRGFVAAERIHSVTINTVTSSGSSHNFDIDNVSRGTIVPAIPEPSTCFLAVLASAAFMLIGTRHTRNQRLPGRVPA
jgi:probable HAF family extracellular repeat protein